VEHEARKVFLKGLVAVERVSHNRMADAEEMGANLMLAAGLRVDVHQGIIREALFHRELG